MYCLVTSLCSDAEGSGVVKSHDLGISALTESLFFFAKACQSAMMITGVMRIKFRHTEGMKGERSLGAKVWCFYVVIIEGGGGVT